MSAGAEHRKLAAIMFTDMVGYSALAQRNEALSLELLEEHRRLLRPIFPRYHGEEIETAGDAFLVEFVSALEAVRCAVEIQEKLSERNRMTPPERVIRIRIGIHVGDVVHKEGKVMGDAVNIAARIEPLAVPGGICVSEDVARQIRNKVDHPLVTLGPSELKNIELPVVICRVVLPWEKAAPLKPAAKTMRSSIKGNLRLVATAVVLILAAISWWFFRHRSPSSASRKTTERITSLAVKPLDDFSGDTNQAYLSDGMTEALCAALGNISALRVPGRSSVMRYKNSPKSIKEMAKDLEVDAIVEGSVQRAANRVLITVQLVEAATDRHLWATNYQRDLRDFFKVQTEVAQAIAAEIQVRLSPQDEARLARARSVNPLALEAYLKGRFYWNRWTEDGGKKALDYFHQAIQIDPSFALAQAGLADTYWSLSDVTFPATEAMPKAKKAAQQALALDDSLAEAHTSLGVVKFAYDFDWLGGEQELERAIALNPGYATAHHMHGWLLAMQGRYDESLAQMKRASELDPLSLGIVVDVNVSYTLTRQYDKGIAQCQKAMEIDSNFYLAHYVLGWIELQRGNPSAAITKLRQARAIENSPWIVGWLGYAEAASGNKEEAQKLLAELDQLAAAKSRYVSPACQALIYLGLGDKEHTLEWLEKAYQARSAGLIWLKVDPLFDPLRAEPQFRELVKKVGLDK